MMSTLQGWKGEKKAQFNMWLFLGKNYKRFHNVIIPIRNSTTQIDHILLSIYGIFVIETKNTNGWIFGSQHSKQWTQTMYGKKYKFQNPIHQNYLHVKALESYLDVDYNNIHSIVFFVGKNVTLKTELPDNVMTYGITKYIKSFKDIVFLTSDILEFEKKIQALKESQISKKEHFNNLEFRHSSNVICSKCGGKLIKRKAKKGKYADNYFLGCSRFPKCKFTKDL